MDLQAFGEICAGERDASRQAPASERSTPWTPMARPYLSDRPGLRSHQAVGCCAVECPFDDIESYERRAVAHDLIEAINEARSATVLLLTDWVERHAPAICRRATFYSSCWSASLAKVSFQSNWAGASSATVHICAGETN